MLSLPLPARAATVDSEALLGTTADNNWEPAVAADPSSNYVYQVTTSVANNPHQILFRSFGTEYCCNPVEWHSTQVTSKEEGCRSIRQLTTR